MPALVAEFNPSFTNPPDQQIQVTRFEYQGVELDPTFDPTRLALPVNILETAVRSEADAAFPSLQSERYDPFEIHFALPPLPSLMRGSVEVVAGYDFVREPARD